MLEGDQDIFTDQDSELFMLSLLSFSFYKNDLYHSGFVSAL